MGFYSRHIFPRLMDWLMRAQEFQRLRSALLASAKGEVLEIGFGTGLNLPHYPGTIASLSVVDPAILLPRAVERRIAQVCFPVHRERATAERLPFPDRQFDTVVSTWTLCTIRDPIQALREIRRALKPTGLFLFLEHGRSENRSVAAWQDRLNPIQNVLGCGCNLNRRIDALVQQGGLTITRLDRFSMSRVPRIVGEMYEGRAIPASST